METKRSTRRRLRDSRNNSFSLSFDCASNESGISFLVDSPILIKSLNKQLPKASILKKKKINNDNDYALHRNSCITVDSSVEIIDQSVNSIGSASDFAWIKTPRSARSKTKNSTIESKSLPTSDQKRKNKFKVTSKLYCHETNNNKDKEIVENTAQPSATNLLAGSKRRNVDQWLKAAVVQSPTTPPMSLSPAKKVHRDSDSDPMDIDPEVKEVLKMVYGDDWQAKPTQKSQTDIKKSRIKSPRPIYSDIKLIRKRTSSGDKRTVRRKVFNDLANKIQEEKLDHIPDKSMTSNRKPKIFKRKKILSPCSGETGQSTPVTMKTPMSKKKSASDFKTPRRTFLASLSVSTPTTASHPDAQMYKLNFAKKKDELCNRLFKLYNSEIFDNQLPQDMLIEWNVKMRGTAGFCYSKKKKTEQGLVRLARLELSSRVVDRADRLRDTLVHEMCHAAAWIINGVQDGHGALWQSWAEKAALRFPELPPIKRCHNYKVMTKFTYRCTVCSYSINRQSRSIDIQRKRCGRCYGVLELLFNKKKKGLSEAPEFETTRTMRAPNRFATFVKENYQSVKKSMPPATKHAQVMKLLSERYSKMKNNPDQRKDC